MFNADFRRFIRGCTFDDFIFEPQCGILESRNPDHIDLSCHLSRNIILKRPIISANMDTITRAEMAILMAEEGGIGIIDRGFRPGDIEPEVTEVKKVKRAQHGVIRDPYTISPDKSLGEAKAMMRQNKVGTLLVINKEGRLVGVVTKRDLRHWDYNSNRVSTVMVPFNKMVVHVGMATTALATEKIRKKKVKSLPLIDEDRRILGLITSKDIIKEQKLPFATVDSQGRLKVGAAIGANNDYLERAFELIRVGVDVIVIDIAHGHSSAVTKKAIEQFRKQFGDFELIAGNVGTASGAKYLYDLGVDGIKVGIGPGSACTTRSTTNFGVPQAQAIVDTYSSIPSVDLGGVPIIADGGIKRDGHIAQALLFGAETVMIGGMFAGTDETPGEIIKRSVMVDDYAEKMPFKRFRGMASIGAMKDRLDIEDADTLDDIGAEGMEKSFPLRGSARIILRNMIKHLCSSISYGGATSLSDLKRRFQEDPMKYLIKQSSEAIKESYKR